MIYIYDILLNFCDLNELYDFYEWNPNDNIENIKRIKMVHVARTTFDDFLYYKGKIDKDFLLKIYRTCEAYTDRKVKILDYCILISDGERVLAVEFDSTGETIYKSKLLIDEEEEIALLANNLEVVTLNFQKEKKALNDRFFTRNEIQIRNYLMKEIKECYNKKNYGKLRFLYEEYFDEEINSQSKMFDLLLNSMKDSLDDKHIHLYQLLRLASKKKQV